MDGLAIAIGAVAVIAGILISQSRSIWGMLVTIVGIGTMAALVALMAGASINFSVFVAVSTIALLDVGLVMGIFGQRRYFEGPISAFLRFTGLFR